MPAADPMKLPCDLTGLGGNFCGMFKLSLFFMPGFVIIAAYKHHGVIL